MLFIGMKRPDHAQTFSRRYRMESRSTKTSRHGGTSGFQFWKADDDSTGFAHAAECRRPISTGKPVEHKLQDHRDNQHQTVSASRAKENLLPDCSQAMEGMMLACSRLSGIHQASWDGIIAATPRIPAVWRLHGMTESDTLNQAADTSWSFPANRGFSGPQVPLGSVTLSLGIDVFR